MKAQCDICFEWISIVDEKLLKFPMSSEMFKSPDPFHGFTDPFEPGSDWEFFKCPYGRHRPFIEPDQVMTDQGLVILPHDGSAAYFFSTGKEPMKIKINDIIGSKEGNNVKKGQVKTEEGKEETFKCHCGKAFEKEINLKRHQGMAHKGV